MTVFFMMYVFVCLFVQNKDELCWFFFPPSQRAATMVLVCSESKYLCLKEKPNKRKKPKNLINLVVFF